MWGIIPAAGNGTRIQPLAFSKELLPVGSRFDGDTERPRAVSEYLVERMLCAGADRICFVISPWKSDILQYFGARVDGAAIAYVVQPEALGLCDAIFRALPLIRPDESVLVGLPDTIWLPEDALAALPDDKLAFLTFPVARPEFFDAVATDRDGRVREIQVKSPGASTRWIWGAFRLPGAVLHALYRLWEMREPPRRIYRDLGQRLSRARGRSSGGGRRHRLCRCRHIGRLSQAMRLLTSKRAHAGTILDVGNAVRRERRL